MTDQGMESCLPVYDSSRKRSAFWEEISEAWRYRDLIVCLIRRDLTSRYKRSILGVTWTLLNPLMIMVVLTLVFSNLFRITTPHYPVYVLSGIVVWNFFAQSTTAAMLHLVWGGGLLNRIYLPRTVFALTAVGGGLVNMLLSLIPLIGIMLATGTPPTIAMVYLPIPILLTALFTLGVGLLLSSLAVSFPDVAEMYQIALAAWYFVTPIIYPKSILPPAVAEWAQWNPMCLMVDLFRAPIEQGSLGDARLLAMGAITSLSTLLVGWLVFTARADKISYRV